MIQGEMKRKISELEILEEIKKNQAEIKKLLSKIEEKLEQKRR